MYSNRGSLVLEATFLSTELQPLTSVTRSGNLLDFGQLLNALGNT